MGVSGCTRVFFNAGPRILLPPTSRFSESRVPKLFLSSSADERCDSADERCDERESPSEPSVHVTLSRDISPDANFPLSVRYNFPLSVNASNSFNFALKVLSVQLLVHRCCPWRTSIDSVFPTPRSTRNTGRRIAARSSCDTSTHKASPPLLFAIVSSIQYIHPS